MTKFKSPFTPEGERVGIIEITRRIMMQDPEFVMEVMGSGIIVRAEFMFATQAVEYQMLCSAFDIMLPGRTIPKYWIDVEIKGRKVVAWGFRKHGTGEDFPVITNLRDLGGEQNVEDDATPDQG